MKVCGFNAFSERNDRPGRESKFKYGPVREKMYRGLPTWSDTNRAVQPQKMGRCLEFRIEKVEGLFYLCSENKDANHLSRLTA